MASDDVSFNYRRATDAYLKVPESQRKIISQSIREVVASFPEGHLGRRFFEEAMKQCPDDCLGALFVAGKIASEHGLAITNETMRILEDKDGHPVFYSICETMAKDQKEAKAGDIRGLSGDVLSRRAMLKRSVGFGASVVLGAEVFTSLFGDFTMTNEKGEKRLNTIKIGRAAAEAIVAGAAFISGSNDKARAEIIGMVDRVDALVRAEIEKQKRQPSR